MMSMLKLIRGCSLSLCRNKREFKPGPYVAGMDADRGCFGILIWGIRAMKKADKENQ